MGRVRLEHLADRADAAVHHVARRHGVRARLDVARRRAREQLERLVVLHLAVAQHAAVAVARVLAEADVGDEHEVGLLDRERTQGELHDAVVVPGRGRLLVLVLRATPKSSTAGTPSRVSSAASSTRSSTEKRLIAGSSSFRTVSGATKSGITKASRSSRVSRTSERSAPVRRSRRSRVAGKELTGQEYARPRAVTQT